MGFEYLTNIPLAKAREDYLELLRSHGFGPKTPYLQNGKVLGNTS